MAQPLANELLGARWPSAFSHSCRCRQLLRAAAHSLKAPLLRNLQMAQKLLNDLPESSHPSRPALGPLQPFEDSDLRVCLRLCKIVSKIQCLANPHECWKRVYDSINLFTTLIAQNRCISRIGKCNLTRWHLLFFTGSLYLYDQGHILWQEESNGRCRCISADCLSCPQATVDFRLRALISESWNSALSSKAASDRLQLNVGS